VKGIFFDASSFFVQSASKEQNYRIIVSIFFHNITFLLSVFPFNQDIVTSQKNGQRRFLEPDLSRLGLLSFILDMQLDVLCVGEHF